MKKTILLGVASGIAAFKILELIKQLRANEYEVVVVMTESATKMISPLAFEKESGNKVLTKLFEKDFDYKKILEARIVEHIDLADKTDVMVIAPATANTVAKLAHGLADDYLTTTALAVTAPIIICPSMNVHMWHNPAVQENIAILKNLGYIIIHPAKGMLACGYEGVGRLAEITDIKKIISEQLVKTSYLKGLKIIVTAGGTREKIDDVRFIANRSSGKMGIALTEALYERGADVLLLRAKDSVEPRYHIKEELFETTDDLFSLIKKYAREYQFFYHNAAVSDFTVKNSSNGKLSSKEPKTLLLNPQIKILDEIKKINPAIKLVGFKAEFESDLDTLKNAAESKLKESDADAIIANDISKPDRGFESNSNEVVIVLKNGQTTHLSLAPKKKIAEQIIDYLQENLL
jgi:phosphopantothenoylcysteine decarboxylase/phosphopantothenate--cysteine ligase